MIGGLALLVSALSVPAAPARTIANVFTDAGAGDYWDFADLSTMFQDTGATTPVASDGDPIRLINGKMGRIALSTAITDAPPAYDLDAGKGNARTTGGQMLGATGLSIGSGYTAVAALLSYNKSAQRYLLDCDGGSGANRIAQALYTKTSGYPGTLAFYGAPTATTNTVLDATSNDLTATAATIAVRVKDGTDGMKIRANGSVIATGTVGGTPKASTGQFTVGARYAGSMLGPSNASFFRVAFIPNGLISDADLAIVETWCAAGLP